ncbi:SdrD B-like domain-containing protein [Microbacterium sp. NPDC076911]|uniref:SdrD B-like domain-containing protein n=1 Tax=Microbacterium sp. NPDC076911 TaxID=3154958 RepID=UPI00341BFCB7
MQKRTPTRRAIAACAAVGVALTTTFTFGAVPALAAGETLNVTLAQITGTPDFDADDAPGNDSSADNDIVRTNDTVAYTVGLRYEGGAQTNPTIEFTLPQGEELVSLPAFCLAGSSVTPATVPAPAVPITATSWESLPIQTITCVVANQNAGTSLDYSFLSKVRSEVPNGTALTPVSASATSDQVTVPVVSSEVSHTVSAAADFDLSKRRDVVAENSGPLFTNNRTCSFDTTRACAYLEYPLSLSGPAGGKGITPLLSPITVTEDLRVDSFYGAGTTTSAAWLAAGANAAELYAPRLVNCAGSTWNLRYAMPGSEATSTTLDSAVRDSGTSTCVQSSLNSEVDIVISDADTSGYTVPTKTSGGSALPADLGFVISQTVQIEIPMDAITDFGIQSGNTWTLNWENTYTGIEATAVDGTPFTTDDPSNNNRTGTSKLQTGFGFDKGYSGITDAAGNTPMGTGGYTTFNYEGPAGSGVWHDGNTVVLPGQTVLSNVLSTQSVPPFTGEQFSYSSLMCDTWDSTTMAMPATFDFAGATSSRVQIPSDGNPAWISSFWQDGYQPNADALENLTIEYGYTATPGAGAASSCDTGVWASTPAGVAGASVVDGLWEGVNRVRVSFSSDAGVDAEAFDVNLSIALTALDSGEATGTYLPNWASIKRVPGVMGIDDVVASTVSTGTSTYNPDNNSGQYGDRLILGGASTRITKAVKNPSTGEFSDSTVPQYTSGALVDYRLSPSLTADTSGTGSSQDVIVEDCLPAYQSFVASVRANGDAISPVLVQAGSPSGSELTCAATETYIKWELGSLPVNTVIDPIIYSVELGGTVRNGLYTNTTVVSSPGDPSSVASRTDTAQIQVTVPTGIAISKTVDKSSVQVNDTGLTNPRSFVWTVDFANLNSPAGISNVDVIDVLPADGISGSDFEGTLALDSVTVAAGTGIEILYTKTPSGSLAVDPADSSNGAAGSAVWCDASTGGSVVLGAGAGADCPTGLNEVTGLRFLRAGDFESTDFMTINIAMTPSGNSKGDVYENITAGRADGVSQAVGPATRTVNVVASSVGDLVWLDANSDGIQDAGELGVEGVPVTLAGTDIDGNTVSETTVTDADGNYLFADLASGDYTVTFDPTWVDANNYTFTLQSNGDDTTIDSDADPVAGVVTDIALGVEEDRTDIDAGLIRIMGGLVINKALEGQGVRFAEQTFAFSVVCTFGGAEIYNGGLNIVQPAGVFGGATLTSDRIGNLPVGSVCDVSETENGGADSTPAPITVIIERDEDTDNTASVAFVNEYSAGTISVEKVLDGTAALTEEILAKTFTVQVVCQVDVDGQEAASTVYTGDIDIKGGEIMPMLDEEGEVILLPAGAICFGTETDDAGADSSSVDFDSFENGVEVQTGNVDELQALKITVTNTFDAVEPTPTPASPPTALAVTGVAVGGTLAAAILLIVLGLFISKRKRRDEVEMSV